MQRLCIKVLAKMLAITEFKVKEDLPSSYSCLIYLYNSSVMLDLPVRQSMLCILIYIAIAIKLFTTSCYS